MDITVYLPDEIGERAKEEELNLSRLLRDAVTDELERRETMAKTLDETETFEVELRDKEDRPYTGQIKGKRVAWDDKSGYEVFLTDDERVLFYDEGRQQYHQFDDPVEQLRSWLSPAMYSEALYALGEKPVVEL